MPLHPWQPATIAMCYHNHGNQPPWQYATITMATSHRGKPMPLLICISVLTNSSRSPPPPHPNNKAKIERNDKKVPIPQPSSFTHPPNLDSTCTNSNSNSMEPYSCSRLYLILQSHRPKFAYCLCGDTENNSFIHS